MVAVISKEKVEESVTLVPAGVKKSVTLTGSKEGPYSVMAVVVNNLLPKAEVHEKSADVWQVLKGEAVFIIGGELESPILHKPKEWVADFIRGGEKYPVKPGDIIDIPAGVPHQIDTRGKRIELVIVKINGLKND